jgi:mandelate racemase
MQKAVEAGTGDLFMPDAGKIGGVTGWMAAAGIAAGRGLRLSSHLYPEVSSHLLAATPTAHWFEYVDWANPVLKQPVESVDGTVTPSSAPGIGIEWDERAVKRYLM